MEELQSTEILDREILEDARKKAQRILKTADDTIKAKSAEWDNKLASVLGELEQKYNRSGIYAVAEIMAALPIDKRRAKAKKIEELLTAAVEPWYAGLSRGRVLALLQEELAGRVAACGAFAGPTGSDGSQAAIHKISRAEAEAMLRAVLPGRNCSIEEMRSDSAYPQIIVENKDVRICVSIGKIVDYCLKEKRSEVVAALLGKASPDGAEGLL